MIWWSHFVRIIESRSCCVWVSWIIQVISLVQTYIVLEILIKASIHSTNWPTSIWKFISIVFTLSFIKRISITICSRLSTTTNCSMIAGGRRTFIVLVHIKTHSSHVHHHVAVVSIVCIIFLVVQWNVVVIKLHRITCTSVCSLLPQLSLSNCFVDVLSIVV